MNKKVRLKLEVCLFCVMCLLNLVACQKEEANTPKKEEEKGVYMENETVVSNPTVDMQRYIVWNDRVYWENGTIIDNRYAKELQGENLGKTHYVDTPDVNEIGEVSMENLSTNIADGLEVYSVKDYDSKYRIMCSIRNEIYLLDCFTELRVVQGEDLMSKINLEDSDIIGAVYILVLEDITKELKELDLLQSMIRDLREADCIEKNMSELEEGISMEIELADHTKIETFLYKEGYVRINNFDGIFHLEKDSYHALYESLK